MASLFGTASEDGMPSAEQFNLGLQKIAGKLRTVNCRKRIYNFFFFGLTEATSMAMSGDGVNTVEPQFVDSITQAIQVNNAFIIIFTSFIKYIFELGP